MELAPAFEPPHALPQRQQAGRSPNASRGSSSTKNRPAAQFRPLPHASRGAPGEFAQLSPVAVRGHHQAGVDPSAKDGRLFVILARTNSSEPWAMLGRTGLDAPLVLALDLKGFPPGAIAVVTASAFAFSITNLAEVPAGDYFTQALFDYNTDLRLAGAPGNLYSKPQQIHFGPAQGGT